MPKWNRNSSAHTPGPLTPSAVVHNGSEPTRGGGDMLGQNENERKAPHCSSKQVPSHLGTISKLPEARRGSEVAGVAPAMMNRDGAEEDEMEKPV